MQAELVEGSSSHSSDQRGSSSQSDDMIPLTQHADDDADNDDDMFSSDDERYTRSRSRPSVADRSRQQLKVDQITSASGE